MSPTQKFIRGFGHASRGIGFAFGQRNMKIHVAATIGVLLFSALLPLSLTEWFIVLILVGLVWTAEILNTAIECLANVVRDSNKLSYQATRDARDLAAGAVLTTSIVAALIGLIIFVPKLL
ncbi:MAG: diacylglycerol kinase family protein [Candidatus Shapirobacteria bacterium]|jgi:diacylglycerol kinase